MAKLLVDAENQKISESKGSRDKEKHHFKNRSVVDFCFQCSWSK